MGIEVAVCCVDTLHNCESNSLLLFLPLCAAAPPLPLANFLSFLSFSPSPPLLASLVVLKRTTAAGSHRAKGTNQSALHTTLAIPHTLAILVCARSRACTRARARTHTIYNLCSSLLQRNTHTDLWFASEMQIKMNKYQRGPMPTQEIHRTCWSPPAPELQLVT